MDLTRFKFDHYFRYDEMVDLLKTLSEKYPDVTKLESIGNSGEGRDIWAVTLSGKADADPDTKPAIYIDGNFHAGEVTGSMINLYAIKYILENYDKEESIAKLLMRYTLYFIPRVSPDGAEVYLTTPETLRSAPRPYPFPEPDRHEGLYAADVDGDGHILSMRIKDDTGEWKVSPKDPRVMVRRAPDEEEGTFYRVYTEGFLHQYDGGSISSAPPKWGLDFNRNFPFGWVPNVEQSGAGEFPLSEPETRAVAEFVVKHPNISLALTYHTTGGVILRVPGAHSQKKSPVQDIEAMIAIGEMGAEETGYPCVPCYEEFYGGGDDFSRGAYDDWLFNHRGILAYTVETWNMAQRAGVHQFPRREKSIKEQEEDYLKMISWNDRDLSGKGFENWRPFSHPQLGEIEIGGWHTKYVMQNAPFKFLEAECHKNSMFILRAAAVLPRIDIESVEYKALGEGVYEVNALVRNVGFLPTFGSHRSKQLNNIQPLIAELRRSDEDSAPDSAEFEVVGKAEKKIGQLYGRSGTTSAFSMWTLRSVGPSRVTRVDWVVKAKKGTRITVSAKGVRAGAASRTIDLQ